MFITTEQREVLDRALELVRSVKDVLTYDHEEYASVFTAEDAIKRAINKQR